MFIQFKIVKVLSNNFEIKKKLLYKSYSNFTSLLAYLTWFSVIFKLLFKKIGESNIFVNYYGL